MVYGNPDFEMLIWELCYKIGQEWNPFESQNQECTQQDQENKTSDQPVAW